MTKNKLLTTSDITPKDKRDAKGGYLERPAQATPFTSETARAAANKRWEKYRRAAVERVVAEGRSIDPNIQGGADAWGMLVAKQWLALLDNDKPHGDDLHRLGQAMGALPMANQAQQQPETPAVSVSLSAVGLERLLSMLQGKVIETGSTTQITDTIDIADIEE